MKKVLLAIGVVMCLAAPVFAQSSSSYDDYKSASHYQNDSLRATEMQQRQVQESQKQEQQMQQQRQVSQMQQQINQQQQQINQMQQREFGR